MPQPRILDFGPESQPDPLGGLLTSFTKQYHQGVAEDKERGTLNKIYDQYLQQDKDSRDISQAMRQIDTDPSLSPTARVNAKKTFMDLGEYNQKNQQNTLNQLKTENERLKQDEIKSKAAADRNRAVESNRGLYNELVQKGLMTAEEADKRAPVDSPETARAVYNQKLKPPKEEKPEPLSPFQRQNQIEEAKKYSKYKEDIAKAEDSLNNIDYLRKLSRNELSGPGGMVKSLLNTESAAEFQNLAFTSIDPIIKLFNPVGPIPVQKLKIIQKQFQVHPWDLQSTIEGKLNALERVGKQAVKRAKDRVALIEQHQGNPPQEILNQFDQESQQIENQSFNSEAINLLKDKDDDELIDGLFGAKNGKELKPIPKREVMKLLEQGLITYVPK